MTASEPLKLNGMEVVPFDQQIAEARERYMSAISEALDAELARLIIPSDRVALLHDAALFVPFMAALKCAEAKTPAGTPIGLKDASREWWPIEKKIKAEVATMLLAWGKEASLRHLQGTGEASDAQG